jgi:putative transposase
MELRSFLYELITTSGTDAMRYMITDAMWTIMEPLVEGAKRHKGGQKPLIPDRQFFEGMLYIARTGNPLRDLPSEFGSWDAHYNRFRRWVASGALKRLFESLTDAPSFGEVRRVFVDGTIMRAHRHAAGALRKKRRSVRNARPTSRAWDAVVADLLRK